MRTFEILLILVNLLSLALNLKRRSKAGRLGIAGGNLSAFFIHGLFEGLRYQMVFSYTFVVLLTIFTFVKINQSLERQMPRALRVIAISLLFVLLLFTVFLSYAFPVFQLPKPTGSYDVGIQYFHLVDESRTDPFLDQSTNKRELMVKIYYPAMDDASKPFSLYFHSPQLVKSFAKFYGMPDFVFNHLSLIKTHVKENLQLSDKQQSYPLILFSHGAGTTMEAQTSQSEDLASHGYVVVTIDHTYVSAATIFLDRVVSHKESTTDFNITEPAEIITQIMADDSSFVIDMLTEMNEGKIKSIFKGRLDLENVGDMGHSVGGAVVYNLALNDNRVKAAIDLDGIVFVMPEGDPKNMTPFLMLANDKYHILAIERRKPLMKTFEEMDDVEQKITLDIYGSKEAYQEAYGKAQDNMIALTEVLKWSGNLFTIEGSDHMKFTDIGLFIGIPQLRELIGIGGKTDPARCLEITEAVTLAFFDQHLKGKPASLESLINKYPELRNVTLK